MILKNNFENQPDAWKSHWENGDASGSVDYLDHNTNNFRLRNTKQIHWRQISVICIEGVKEKIHELNILSVPAKVTGSPFGPFKYLNIEIEHCSLRTVRKKKLKCCYWLDRYHILYCESIKSALTTCNNVNYL